MSETSSLEVNHRQLQLLRDLFDRAKRSTSEDGSSLVIKKTSNGLFQVLSLAEIFTQATPGTVINDLDTFLVSQTIEGSSVIRSFTTNQFRTLINPSFVRRVGGWMLRGTGVFKDPWGDAATGSAGSESAVNATATEGYYLKMEAVGAANAYISGQSTIWRPGRNYAFGTRVKVSDAADGRLWLGLIDSAVTITTFIDNDVPAAAHTAAFRASSVVPDTNFKAVCSNAGTQTVVDTGVVIDTNPHTFQIIEDTTAGVWSFYIDKVLVAEISTNLPASSSSFYQAIGLRPITLTQSFSYEWIQSSADY